MDAAFAANSIVFALIQSVLFLLLIRFLDLYEREPLSLLALMAVWGAVGATFLSGLGNEALDKLLGYLSPEVKTVLGAALTAPLVEETAKGIALVVAFVLSYLLARRFGVIEINGVTDGIVYGAAVGLGFAFAEDILYFFNNALDQEDLGRGLEAYLARVDFFGSRDLGHAVYTGTFGAGLGLATWSRGWTARIFFSLLGLGIAMLMHAINNGVLMIVLILGFGLEATAEFTRVAESAAGSGQELSPDLLSEPLFATGLSILLLVVVLKYVFVALFFLVMVLWVRYQRRVIREELAEEMDNGLISREEWELVPHYWRRSKLYWRLLWSGKLERWRTLRRLHQEMVDLALLKRRLRRTGSDDWDRVERLKQRIKALKSQEIVELVDDTADTAAELT
ncbi:MAG: protease PrsW [Rubrobacteraceae bacterium]|nr:protease PrsW [Rubrobacteraceae bacterium]